MNSKFISSLIFISFTFISNGYAQSNLLNARVPQEIGKINGDCESDMSPYAAAIIRLFTKNDFKNLNINRNYFINSKIVKNFYITTNSQTCTYFGNFSFHLFWFPFCCWTPCGAIITIILVWRALL